MKDGKLTIAIPTYNRLGELEKRIQNIKTQIGVDFVCLISDNCSEDEAYFNRIKEGCRDPRFIFYRQKRNVGLTNNMLFLLEKVDTEYFLWAQDDDEFEDDFCRNCLTLLEKEPSYVAALTDVRMNFSAVGGVSYSIGRYLNQFASPSRLNRLINYLLQAPVKGKARWLWSVCRADVLKRAVSNTMTSVRFLDDEPKSFEFCADLVLIAMGPVAVFDKTGYEVKILESSVGASDARTVKSYLLLSYYQYRAYFDSLNALEIFTRFERTVLASVISLSFTCDLGRLLFYKTGSKLPFKRHLKNVWTKITVGRL